MTGIHFLLTYRCSFECDHCFLYCGPRASGTFTVEQIRRVLAEAKKIGTVDTIYYEGGEPFLFYPLMVEGIRLARAAGMKTGVVTNAYWATAPEDADLWLGPLCEHNLFDLSLSDDVFHSGDDEVSAAKRALGSAERLGLPVSTICIEEPKVEDGPGGGGSLGKGEPVVGGDVVFRGRAVDKLAEGLPRKPWSTFAECKREELESPGRVHVDSFGNVHVCQGLSMGNMWERPLSEIVRDYDAKSHPICGPLMKGGPAELARKYGVEIEEGYIDECHLCYSVRKALLHRFPEYLGPEQVYGIEK
jgi:MoaA/NifB/PqqE/SkfB family radical SAM enzyme